MQCNKPQTLIAHYLSSKFSGASSSCWSKLKAVNSREMSFGWFAVNVPHHEVYYLEYCHSSSTFSSLTVYSQISHQVVSFENQPLLADT